MITGDYRHGAYGETIASSDKVSVQSKSAPIYVGTAPVHTIAGGKKNLNTPVVVSSFAEAARLFGYSDDWAHYTLCEAMHAHFIINGIAPLVLINCLNVDANKSGTGSTVSVTPVNGRAVIPSAEDIILDSVKVGTKVLGVDYAIAYDHSNKKIIISQMKGGSLGTAALSITYDKVDASGVTTQDIIGQSDGEGSNTGLFAVKDVYQATGYIPAMLLCPGFSCVPAVHKAMIEMSLKVNGHWDQFVYADIPLMDGTDRMTMEAAKNWKNTNGYTNANEKVFFPKVKGKDGCIYHISVLACANKQVLDAAQDGIPFHSSSNTYSRIIQSLFFGDVDTEYRVDDATINEKLNQNGIASAAFVGGKWVV